MVIESENILSVIGETDQLVKDGFSDYLSANKVSSLQAYRVEGNVTYELTFLDDFSEVKQALKKSRVPHFFMVHLNLTKKYSYDGMAIIKFLREEYPDAFIVGYSAYKDANVMLELMEVNASFFELNFSEGTKNLTNLSQKIYDYFLKKETSLSHYYGKIKGINKEDNIVWVRFEKKEEETIRLDKYLNTDDFVDMKDLFIGKPILLKVYKQKQKGNHIIRWQLEETEPFDKDNDTTDWDAIEQWQLKTI